MKVIQRNDSVFLFLIIESNEDEMDICDDDRSFFIACQNDKDMIDMPGEEQNEEIETIPVQLSFKTYAAIDTEGKNGMEVDEYSPINEVELYIFRRNGLFYDHWVIPVTKNYDYVYTSANHDFPKGDWYIYVIINKPDNFLQEPIKDITTIEDFEQQTVEVGVGTKVSDWISRYLRLMVTLSREMKTIGYSGNSPETVHLKVGHILSKVAINQNDPWKQGDNIKGTFEHGGKNVIPYFISNEPKKVFLIGQWSGTFLQSQALSPHFYNCVPDNHFHIPFYDNNRNSDYWYAVENTNHNPTYKNSSSFILQFIYKPHKDELYDENHKPGASTASGTSAKTFWMAEFSNGTKLLYNVNPENLQHPKLGFPVKASEYKNGECYYRVPIADNTETIPSRIYGLIRNHSYYLTVKSISSLGSHTWDEWDDTEPPLGKDEEIDIEINVIDWEPYEIPVELD